MEEDPVYRQYHHHNMTFGMVYAYSERFVLPLSHDEVVHGKGSLLGKMPGDTWQKFANLRAYFGFMWTHPGKKLLFMGGEFGQMAEFNHDTSPHWHLLDDPNHHGVQKLVRDLNHLYSEEPALYMLDSEPGGFDWLIGDDSGNSVYAYRRTDGAGREVRRGLQYDAGAARRLPDRHAARRTLGRSAEHGRWRIWRLEHGQRRPDSYRRNLEPRQAAFRVAGVAAARDDRIARRMSRMS